MNEVSGIQRLTSQPPRVSLESVQKQAPVVTTERSEEIKQIEISMEKINQAFALTHEIRAALESALDRLSP
jgi:hypothetical protein